MMFNQVFTSSSSEAAVNFMPIINSLHHQNHRHRVCAWKSRGGGLVASVSIAPLPPPSVGKQISILTIDGGGVRGLIPAASLACLEAALQKEEQNDNVRLADYFDVIGGTSTGGLVAAMLTAPDQNNRPLFAASEIKKFYFDNSPHIFPKLPWWKSEAIHMMLGPKYDGEFLHELARDKLQDTRMHQTLTNVVIPTFDVKFLLPTIFSTYKAKDENDKRTAVDALLSDVCIGTSAAPVYFPAHYFTNTDDDGITREFNLIDGGVTENNPSLVALSEVSKYVERQEKGFKGIAMEGLIDRVQVLSLGTGWAKNAEQYDAKMVAKWGARHWLIDFGDYSSPIVDIFSDANADMIDYHMAAMFQAENLRGNYLRIQDDTLSGTALSLDNATTKNMDLLANMGEELLLKQVTRKSLTTGELQPVKGEGTNEAALKRFAGRLYEERKLRMQNAHTTSK